jgi:hypothetical protein
LGAAVDQALAIQDAGRVAEPAQSNTPRKPFFNRTQIAIIVVGVTVIAGYAIVSLYPRPTEPPAQPLPSAVEVSADEQALAEQACDELLARFAGQCPDVLEAIRGGTCNAELTNEGTYIGFGGDATFLIDAEQNVLAASADAAAVCPSLPWTAGLDARLCEQVSAALGERCPEAGGLAVENCIVMPGSGALRDRDRGIGPGRYVHFGTGPIWFVDAESTVLTSNDVAQLLCPRMRTVKERARQRAREAALQAREGDPTVCSLSDITAAEILRKSIDGIDDERADERAFKTAASGLGLTVEQADIVMEKVAKYCPEAI